MSDDTVLAMDAFEESLGQGLRALSEHALRHADPLAVTREAAVARPTRQPWPWPFDWGIRRANGRATVIVATTLVVLGAVVGTLLLAGVRPTPPPFLGGRLVYTLDGDIYVASADGTDPVRIADGNAEGNGIRYELPRWLPGGGHLSARATFPYDRDPGLIVFDSPDGLPRMVGAVGSLKTEATGGAVWHPDGLPGQPWAPDGRRWARIGEGTLEIVEADGSATPIPVPAGQVRWDDSDLATIAWAPDGSGVFAGACATNPCNRGTGTESAVEHDLYFVPLDGRPADRLATPGDPVWRALPSPDGSHLAFIGGGLSPGQDGGPTYHWNSMYLAVQAADGTDRRILFDDLSMPVRAPAVLYAWSPDGRHLAFNVPKSAGINVDGLWIADLETDHPPRRVRSGDWTALAWSADGRQILGRHESGGTSGLWSVDADDSEVVRLVDGASNGDWEWLPRGETPRLPSSSPAARTPAPDRRVPTGTAVTFTRPFEYTVPDGSALQPAFDNGAPQREIVAFVDGRPRIPDLSEDAFVYGGQAEQAAMPRGIVIGSGDRAWSHGAGGRFWLRTTPGELLEDLRTKAIVPRGEIEVTTIDGRPALAVDIFGTSGNDIHFTRGLGGLSGSGFTSLGYPSRLVVLDVAGSTVVIHIWARTDDDLAAWLPIANEFVDSIHFLDAN